MSYESAKVANFIGEYKRQSILNAFMPVKKSNNAGVIAPGHRIEKRVIDLNSDLEKSHSKEDCDYDDVIMKADEESQKKVKKVMKEFKSGKLKSSSGDSVTDRKQAIAIAMSEAGLSNNIKKGGVGSGHYDHKLHSKYKIYFDKKEAGDHGIGTKRNLVAQHRETGEKHVLGTHTDSEKWSHGSGERVASKTKRSHDFKWNKEGAKKVIHENVTTGKKYSGEDLQNQESEDKAPKIEDLHKKLERAHDKHNSSDIQKAHGEGSKGGKVIGHTKSGKPIYANKGAKDSIYSNFNLEDHKDAKEAHEAEKAKHQKEIPQFAFERSGPSAKHPSMKKRDAHDWKAHEHDMEHSRMKREASEIKKANSSGEGSKGGKVVAHTQSGKPIYENANHASHSSFSTKDHMEASDYHDAQYESLEKKYPKESKRPQEVQKQMSNHAAQATSHYNSYKSGQKQDKQLKKAIENIMS